MTTCKAPRKDIYFMKFPPEIREIIYANLLIEQNPIIISQARSKLTCSFLSLSLLSKSLHAETTSYFFRKNTFSIGDQSLSYTSPSAEGLKRFLRIVPKESLSHVRRIHLTISFSRLYLQDEKTSSLIWMIDNRSDLNWIEKTIRLLHDEFPGLKYLKVMDRIVKPLRPRSFSYGQSIWRNQGHTYLRDGCMDGLVRSLEGLLPLRDGRGVELAFHFDKDWENGAYGVVSQLEEAVSRVLSGCT